MSRPGTIGGEELGALLGLSEAEVLDLAQRMKLPFWVASKIGFHIKSRDLPLYQHAVGRESDGGD
jgi:hypothetical protein